MAIHIAICDDEAAELSYLQQLIDIWAQQRGRTIRTAVYDSAEAFLFAFDEDKLVDILLLDIQMGGMDGVSLAKKVRQISERTQIVFITGFPDFMSEGFEVSALHYLMKPVARPKLLEVLDRAAARLAAAPRAILLPVSGGRISLIAREILYAEVFSHDVELHTVKETIHLKISLNELEGLLGEGFFRCHRSYIINMKHVRRITRKVIILENMKELPLSRSLYDAANQAYIQYR